MAFAGIIVYDSLPRNGGNSVPVYPENIQSKELWTHIRDDGPLTDEDKQLLEGL